MSERQLNIIVRRSAWGNMITLTDLARESHCTPSLIERLVSSGVIESVGGTGAEMLFDLSAIRRLKRGLRLEHDLGIDTNDLALVLDLLDRIDELEEELQRIRDAE
jgi:hypothetical protein